MDLARWWRDRRWRGLLDLIDQLPAASRVWEAVQDDPEEAMRIALAREDREARDDGEEPDRWSPRAAEFDLHAHLLRDLIQTTRALQATVAASAGGKARQPDEYPRPRTGVDKAIEALDRRWAVGMASRFGFSEDDL